MFFLSFELFFTKCTFLKLQHFFSPSAYRANWILSMIVWMYKIHVFDEVFFSLCNCCYDNWNSVFLSTPLCSLVIQTVPVKMESNRQRLTKKDSCKILSSTPLLTPSGMVKIQQKLLFLDFYWHLSCNWVNLICLVCLIFLRSPWWLVWTVWAQDFLKGIILSTIICVLLNLQLFSRTLLSGYLCELMSVIKNFRSSSPCFWKILVVMNHCKNMLVMKQFFQKISF